jgi:hypothetical protein
LSKKKKKKKKKKAASTAKTDSKDGGERSLASPFMFILYVMSHTLSPQFPASNPAKLHKTQGTPQLVPT